MSYIAHVGTTSLITIRPHRRPVTTQSQLIFADGNVDGRRSTSRPRWNYRNRRYSQITGARVVALLGHFFCDDFVTQRRNIIVAVIITTTRYRRRGHRRMEGK